MTAAIGVRGAASAEEVAAVVAALSRTSSTDGAAPSGYEQWRLGRIAARRKAVHR